MGAGFRVLHIITGLHQGGAEAVLFRLVTTKTSGAEHVVVSLRGEGFYGSKLRSAGVPLYTIDMPRGRLTLTGVVRLYRLLRRLQPDVVKTWMHHANLVGGLAARVAGIRSVVWGIRSLNLLPGGSSYSARLAVKLCAWLSPRVPSKIISCSSQAAREHQQIGFAADKFIIVPNGYDLANFAPDKGARRQLRQEWGIAEGQPLIGLVARWHPLKDHANLLAALAQIGVARPELCCVLVGHGMGPENHQLSDIIRRQGLSERVILAGMRDDIPAVMNALDLHVLSSCSEAFPNVVAEAMACGTPCVVTDVGEAAFIVGDTGWVVPKSNPAALASAMAMALTAIAREGRENLGRRCRQRIQENFEQTRTVNAYVNLWQTLVAGR